MPALSEVSSQVAGAPEVVDVLEAGAPEVADVLAVPASVEVDSVVVAAPAAGHVLHRTGHALEKHGWEEQNCWYRDWHPAAMPDPKLNPHGARMSFMLAVESAQAVGAGVGYGVNPNPGGGAQYMLLQLHAAVVTSCAKF